MKPQFEPLEFNKILEKLQEQALSQQAKEMLTELEPILSEDICRRKMAETTAARQILDGCGSPPLPTMNGLDELLTLADMGGMLVPEQLTAVAQFAAACKRMTAYLRRGEGYGAAVAVYGRSLGSFEQLQKEITAAVSDERVFDEASSALRTIRRRMEHLEAQIKDKLAHILQSRKQYLAESYIAQKNGRYVLPVQRRYQSQFGGSVVEVSGKGSTVFMEPTAVASLQSELTALGIEEEGEVRRILYTLSALVAEQAEDIRRTMLGMEVLDVVFAKAKLSAAMGACAVTVGGERRLRLRQARHPLLSAADCVPLDFEMDTSTSGVIITGPNTGGKTVATKTVGLLSLMAQCGLHIPCDADSYVTMQDGYWCDIGDSQNISQNLSTFSGHITNVIRILEQASRDSLVLLDELGSGTDPAEGMGIAIAVLEELRQRGCMFLVTTHYPQVKTYAEQTDRVQSARMAFDPESLRPLYRLEMGKSGESCALLIAQRLGLPPHLLERAHHAVYGTGEPAGTATAARGPKSRLVRTAPPKTGTDPAAKFAIGDSVMVLPIREVAIVYRPANEVGDVVVQIKGQKKLVRHDRLRLQVPASELYPPDYDFSIIFDSVDNRKARHVMTKRYDANAVIQYEDEQYERL